MKKYLFVILLSLSSSLYGQDISFETQKYYVLANEWESDSVCNLVYTVKNVSSTPQVVLLTEDDVNTMPLKTLIKRKLMRRYGDFSIAFFLWDGNVENHSAHVLVPEYFIKYCLPTNRSTSPCLFRMRMTAWRTLFSEATSSSATWRI